MWHKYTSVVANNAMKTYPKIIFLMTTQVEINFHGRRGKTNKQKKSKHWNDERFISGAERSPKHKEIKRAASMFWCCWVLMVKISLHFVELRCDKFKRIYDMVSLTQYCEYLTHNSIQKAQEGQEEKKTESISVNEITWGDLIVVVIGAMERELSQAWTTQKGSIRTHVNVMYSDFQSIVARAESCGHHLESVIGNLIEFIQEVTRHKDKLIIVPNTILWILQMISKNPFYCKRIEQRYFDSLLYFFFFFFFGEICFLVCMALEILNEMIMAFIDESSAWGKVLHYQGTLHVISISHILSNLIKSISNEEIDHYLNSIIFPFFEKLFQLIRFVDFDNTIFHYIHTYIKI
ncbi:hypothetical protein RFI_13945 [Reticulomyxa filosa]|uniref:Uncharacterized protein n=1 Tax=Reticulomyxa filosa TaxID=46433 RepID=X6NAB2_RETFI|nr:hypothetical protein RFI_13945 [Reticulomyxa filosa]|eukprot:ETO23235.1 hypothetical protein RFI_13945 [Reticulomyxa filosa]